MTYRHYVFFSYTHEDESIARWLQKKVKSYRFSSAINKGLSSLEKREEAFFSDLSERNSGIMSDNIKEELLSSRYLIVLCSPHAVSSELINQEVQTFIDAGRLSDILLVFSSGVDGAQLPIQTCCPKSLMRLPNEQIPPVFNLDIEGKNKGTLLLLAKLFHQPFPVLWKDYRRRMFINMTLWGALLLLLLMIGGVIFDYNRIEYRYYADWVYRWESPEGIFPVTEEQVLSRESTYRFEYKRPPIFESLFGKRRLDKVVKIQSDGRVYKHELIGKLKPIRENILSRYSILQLNYHKGVVTSLFFYDEHGHLKKEMTFSEYNGHRAGISYQTYYDLEEILFENKNMRKVSLYDKVPYFIYERTDDGYVKQITFHYNNNQDALASIMFNVYFYCYGLRYELNENHQNLSYTFLNQNMEPETQHRGYEKERFEYDDNGNLLCDYYVNKDGELVYNFDRRVARLDYHYDKNGNVTSIASYDQHDSLCINSYNIAKVEYGYNTKGQLTHVNCSDVNGFATFSIQGFCETKLHYDVNNNLECISYYGADSKPVDSYWGYAVVRYVYDKQDRVIQESFFDESNAPTEHKDGYSVAKYKFDSKSYESEHSFFDIYGEPISNSYARMLIERDDKGRPIGNRYYQQDGSPFVGKNGAYMTTKYNDMNLVEEFAFYDADGSPYMTLLNCASVQFEYDEYGNLITCSYFDQNKQPVLSKNGAASVRFQYKQYYTTDMSYYGIDGQPIRSSSGYARMSVVYDSLFQSFNTYYYGVDGKLCKRKAGTNVFKRCDERGLTLETAFFDENNQPMSYLGFHSWKAEYDERGNRIKCFYYDINDKPVVCDYYGFSSWSADYDACNRRIVQRYYGTDGKPCANNVGCAMWKCQYEGESSFTTYYDLQGNVIDYTDKVPVE